MEYLQIKNTPNSELLINRPLIEMFTQELIKRGLDVTFAEGASGGCLIDSMTIPGSTRIIHIGGVFYSTESKRDLGVTEKTIQAFGEFSPEVAREMALAMLNRSGAVLSIATVGRLDCQTLASRKYISVAFAIRGQNPWVKTIFLPEMIQSRRLSKTIITQSIISHALHYLRGDKKLFNSDQSGFQFVNISLTNHELVILDTFAEKVITNAHIKGIKIATVESCTAGAIANALTNVRGSSDVFDRGWLAYDENVKASLGVPMLTMANGNVYSLKVAQAMADAVQKSSRADMVIATTGTMETIDTRPFHHDTLPGTIYVAILVKGSKPFLKKIVVPCPLSKSREQLKAEVVAEILVSAQKSLEGFQTIPRSIDFKLFTKNSYHL